MCLSVTSLSLEIIHKLVMFFIIVLNSNNILCPYFCLSIFYFLGLVGDQFYFI